jgi:hypothetical protein
MIYKIASRHIPSDPCYIGSTTKSLIDRFNSHIKKYKRWKINNKNFISSFILFDKYGIENCEIILMDDYNINNKIELLKREQHWIDLTDNINQCKAYKSKQEKLQDKWERKWKKYENKEAWFKTDDDFTNDNILCQLYK